MFVVRNLIQEYWSGRLVGHPYIASLWLGFPICEALAPKSVLRQSLALFCLLPGHKLWISVNKGVKGFLCYLCAHFCVWRGSMLCKAFCLVFHGSHSNNCEQILIHRTSKLKLSNWSWSKPECEVWDDVSETGLREMESDATQILQPHLRRVLILQDVPVTHELKKEEESRDSKSDMSNWQPHWSFNAARFKPNYH